MESFKTILDKDEIVIKEYKPNKTRAVALGMLSLIPLLIIGSIFVVISILQFNSIIKVTTEVEGEKPLVPFVFLGFGIFIFCIFAFVFIYGIIFTIISYKKRLYCLTNKRIIIRSGFIGVDFNALDIKAINSVNVRVNFLDKWVKPNTGTIIFGSATTPLGGQNKNSGMNGFAFSHIENPYEVYKEIKEMSIGE